jgi:endoplasmic reticulum junction formation protein lunapark
LARSLNADNDASRIYAIRALIAAFYSFRIDSLETGLKGFQAERTTTIQKLKDATKYDSTLELIQKYGGAEARAAKDKDKGGEAKMGRKGIGGEGDANEAQVRRTPGRTGLPPPPTANIPRRDPMSGPGTPQQHQAVHSRLPPDGASPQTPSLVPASEEFAPNAFAPAPPAPHVAGHYDEPQTSHWYDRVLDLLLGEDETAPKNRIVLICNQCRLVNGQAPPGIKSLADLGLWKCVACGAPNGEADEGSKIVREVLEARRQESGARRSSGSAGSEATSLDGADSRDGDSSDLVDVAKEESEQEKLATARRRKGKGKKQAQA